MIQISLLWTEPPTSLFLLHTDFHYGKMIGSVVACRVKRVSLNYRNIQNVTDPMFSGDFKSHLNVSL